LCTQAAILAGHVVASSSQGTVRSSNIVAGNQIPVDRELLEPVTGLGGKCFARGKDIQMPCKVCKTPSAGAISPVPRRLVSKMSDANQRLNATLPTHVAALTSEIPGVVDEIGGRVQLCLTSGPNAGKAEIESFTAQLHAARSLTKQSAHCVLVKERTIYGEATTGQRHHHQLQLWSVSS
jgi:hypothetical protein